MKWNKELISKSKEINIIFVYTDLFMYKIDYLLKQKWMLDAVQNKLCYLSIPN
jgi:hypothetical protein